METEELAILRKLVVLWNGRKLIIIFTIIACIASVVYAYRQPLIYRAECHFLPPTQEMNRISSLSGSLVGNTAAITPSRLGGISDTTGYSDSVTNGQMVLGIMRQNSVLDTIIDRFDLMELYKQSSRSKMRDFLSHNILETADDPKSGILTVAVIDESPQRAADMANAFIEALQAKMLDLSLSEAIQRRIFFEEQTEKNRELMNKAEADMLAYQQEAGAARPETEVMARVDGIVRLQQQIISKNSEISALLTYAKPDNPKVRAARSQLETLTRELERLENERKNSNTWLSVEYQRYAMNLHLATAAYEAVLKQYENAKIDEAQGFFPLQVIDYATPPDFKFKPSKARIIVVGTFIGMFIGGMLVVVREFTKNMKNKLSEYIQMLPEGMIPSKKKNKGIIRSFLPFIFVVFATAVIFFLTFQSLPKTTSLGREFQVLLSGFFSEGAPAWVSNITFLRTFAHLPLYFVLGISAFASFYLSGVSFRRSLLISFVFSACVGLLDEAVKIYLPGREFDLVDWTVDLAGILLGLFITAIFRMVRRHED